MVLSSASPPPLHPQPFPPHQERPPPLLPFDKAGRRASDTRRRGGQGRATCLLSQALNPAAGSTGHFHNPEQKSHQIRPQTARLQPPSRPRTDAQRTPCYLCPPARFLHFSNSRFLPASLPPLATTHSHRPLGPSQGPRALSGPDCDAESLLIRRSPLPSQPPPPEFPGNVPWAGWPPLRRAALSAHTADLCLRGQGLALGGGNRWGKHKVQRTNFCKRALRGHL